jgi:hypothetical protein
MATAPVSKKQIIVSRATGTHCYKYSAFVDKRRDWLKDLILNHHLYAPTVKELADPSEAKPRLAPQSEDSVYAFLYNSPMGILGRNPRMSLPEQIWHGMVLEVNLKKYGLDWCMGDLTKVMHKEFEDFRVYSLTKRFNNLSLWENYADSHSGYCLEFANDGVFRLANEVNYEDAPEFDLLDDDQRSGWFLFYKRVDYRSEEEVRMHVPRMFPGGLVPFDPQHLTRLILGRHMPEADRALIREWAKQRIPELKVVNAIWDAHALDIRIQG